MTEAQGVPSVKVRRPEDFTHHHAKINGIDMHYVIEGSGEPLLLVHGWPGFWWEYWPNIGPLAEKYQVIVPDLRGFGDSEKVDLTDPSNYDLEHIIRDLAALLDHLGVEKAYLAGHDWGGLILHKFVRAFPEKSRKLLIVNPFLPGCEVQYLSPSHVHVGWYAQFQLTPLSVQLVGYNRDTIKMYFGYMFAFGHPGRAVHTDEELEIVVDNFMKPDNVQGGFMVYRAAFAPGSAGAWSKLDRTVSDIPFRVLWGMKDIFVPAEWGVYISDWYTNFTERPVHEGGHFLNRDSTEIFNSEVAAFFVD